MAGPASSRTEAVATLDEVSNLLGHIDPETAAKVLELQPSIADLEEVAMWLGGQGDLVDRAGRPLADKVAAIYEMVAADNWDEDR